MRKFGLFCLLLLVLAISVQAEVTGITVSSASDGTNTATAFDNSEFLKAADITVTITVLDDADNLGPADLYYKTDGELATTGDTSVSLTTLDSWTDGTTAMTFTGTISGLADADQINFIVVGDSSTEDNGGAGYEFQVDGGVPTISALDPADAGTSSNVDQPITATLADTGSGIDEATISMNVEGTDYTTADAELAYSAGTVTFTPSTSFTDAQEVNITLDVSDALGNAATQASWMFTISAADTTAPDEITGLTVTELTDTSVQLDWTASGAGDLDHYNIYQETSAITEVSSLTAVGTTDSSTTTYEADSLTTNINYYFAVTAVDGVPNENPIPAETVSISPGTPAAPGKPSVSAGNGAVTISWSAHGEVDVTEIKIYRITAGDAWDANTSVTTVATGTTEYTDSGLGNGTGYYYKISAQDALGHVSAASESSDLVTPVESGCSLGTPNVESSTHTHNSWTANGSVDFSWASVSSATGYSFVFDQSSSTTPNETIDFPATDYTESKADGIFYFHLRACTGSCCGSTNHFTVKIDTTGPSTPSDFTATARSDGTIRLEWDASSDDEVGMGSYEVYRSVFRDFGISDSGTHKLETTTNTYFTDDDADLRANTTYYYKLRPLDDLGNPGSMTPERNARSEIGCDITINIDVDDYVREGTVDVSVSSAGGRMYDTDVKLKFDGKTTRLEDNKNNTSLISTSFTVDSGETGNAQILIMGYDSEDNLCDALADFYIDASEPSITWEAPEGNAELSGIVDLKADASDAGSGIKTVNFYYKSTGDWEKISGVTKKTGGNYVYSWDTSELADGQYELKAEAKDKAANADEAIISVSLKNNGESPPVPPPSEETTYKTAKYNFSSDNLVGLVNATNLIGAQSEKAVELLSENGVERNLTITKKGTDSLATYDAKIEIKFTNNSGETKTIQIIEFVPKSFAEDSSEISGGFTVIESDPIIKFSATVDAGESATFSYELRNISRNKADALIDDGVINDFIAPPVPLPSGETPRFKQAAGGGIDLVTIIIIVIIILVVLALIFVMFGSGLFVRHSYKKYKKGKSEGAGPWGLNDAVKDVHKGDSIWSNVSRELDDWFNAKEKGDNDSGKFAWRPGRD